MSESRAIVAREQAGEIDLVRNLEDVSRIANFVAESKLFGGIKIAEAVVKILAGREMGFNAMQSMTSIHIIEGKPAPGADLIAAALRRKGSGYDFKIDEISDQACQVTFYRYVDGKKEVAGTLRYTMEEVKKKGWHLTKGGKEKDPWIQKPANMLFARVITDGKRFFAPDVLGSVFDKDEIDSPAASSPPTVEVVYSEPVRPQPAIANASAADPERPTELVVNDDGSLSDSVDLMTECRVRIEALQNELGISPATMRSRLISNFQAESIHELHDLPSLQRLEQMLLSAKAARATKKNGASAAATSHPTSPTPA